MPTYTDNKVYLPYVVLHDSEGYSTDLLLGIFSTHESAKEHAEFWVRMAMRSSGVDPVQYRIGTYVMDDPESEEFGQTITIHREV